MEIYSFSQSKGIESIAAKDCQIPLPHKGEAIALAAPAISNMRIMQKGA